MFSGRFSRRFATALFVLVSANRLAATEPVADRFRTAADYDKLIQADHRRHWSFVPVKRPQVPEVKDRSWIRNPIDNFILSSLESKGWRPSPPASSQALLRRMHLDVVGLPPTLVEQESFLKDSSAAAIEKRVDQLLANPGYGERWGRYWLDLVRYADSNGYERDGAKPHVWRYRDYVIKSLNEDKPYNRFILEQLAGDELPDSNTDSIVALGFYRLGPWDDEPADKAEDRADQLDDIVNATSQVFLGLTLGCARCHNHKFEPLSQLDYYRLTAVFNTLRRFQNDRQDLDAPAGTPAQLAAERRRDGQIADCRRQIEQLKGDFQKEYLSSGRCRLPADVIAAFQADRRKRTDGQKNLVSQHAAQFEKDLGAATPEKVRRQMAHLEAETVALRKATPDLPRAYYMHEPSPSAPPTHVLLRGRASRPGIVADPGVPAVLTDANRPLTFPHPSEQSSRRRLTLAQWLASLENPLTARVIVNRVWQFHFGEGLVRTPSDFGVMGQAPTHPELLDWLTDRFVADGWSLKKLHRLILTSNTYRMSKQSNAEYAAKDPENELWWRIPYRRLEVEPLRDSILAVSGSLNPKMYGPSIYPHIPAEALAGSSDPDKVWKASDPRDASRRTIYAFVKRSLVVPFLEVMDFCDTTRSSPQRGVTCIAPQALTLFNSQFVNEQAGHFAQRLEREAGTDWQAQVKLAYRLALCREPTANELEAMLEFLKQESSRGSSKSQGRPSAEDQPVARHHALTQLCRAIFNLNEFSYTD